MTPVRGADDGRDGYVAFVESHQHRLLRAAYLICGNRHQAEDLLQDALLKLALRWPTVRDGDPAAYVRSILYRDAISWWRRRRREWLSASPPERAGQEADGTLRLALHRALAGLPPRQRAVLVLRYFEDLTETATAEALGVTVGTVKSQSHAALRRLRETAPELSRDHDRFDGDRTTGMEVTP
ncbi:SigE family RNA polymerase sigma factor [Micromonospora endolithica]|uniref:SigE family RNA polymerase sigma factor n=1 Tax=Micromonospora endolithica TaxID=230091 RepID=A0A3A9ZDM1_9ACTN|nr:SigE family RNA polymerase sigma factor [Micromonospora endolithica]RKN46378.1 SigE family RNA polymerase sigma factor [Micromonospora endolithica]TWJ24883.1 RNA polymerase sigma-70 factor (sigma-E family) [Micromonospora endolithica]